jgi:pimeloyl-ACP methyl ester carboxylesterase
MDPKAGPARVVLVHGAWHGAWCWDPVLQPLRTLGFEPDAIDLPGHGDSTEPLGDLHGDADAVRGRLDAIGGPVLLVGHSYGGMVITDAGAHDAVSGLVYVCAFMPDAGQSLMDLWSAQRHRPEGEPPSELAACTHFSADRSRTHLEGAGVVDALYADCSPATQQWALERLDSQPTASFTQAPRRVAWRSKPSIYLVCSADRTIPAWHQRLMAEHANRVVELGASHSPFLSRPDRLVDLLAEAGRRIASA